MHARTQRGKFMRLASRARDMKRTGGMVYNNLEKGVFENEFDENAWNERPLTSAETACAAGIDTVMYGKVRAPTFNTLTSLTIKDQAIMSYGCKLLGEALHQHQVMEELIIANTHLVMYLDPESRDLMGLQKLRDSIKTMPKLNKLDISNNNLQSYGVRILASALHNNQVMIELNLSGNLAGIYEGKLNFDGITYFAAAVKTAKLKKLVLKKNALRNETAGGILADMLTLSSSLTEFDVSDNGYESDDDGVYESNQPDDGIKFAKALATGLKSNSVLESFNISNNNIMAQGLDAIQRVASNMTLTV